jgi:hypothetical protein
MTSYPYPVYPIRPHANKGENDMTLTLSDDAFAQSMKQCESHRLHREAKEKLIAQKKRLADFRKQREANENALTHTVTLDGDDRIQIMVNKLYDKKEVTR